MSGSKLDDVHQEWLKRPTRKAEYEALGDEFALASVLIEARARAGLSQAQVADRMQTTQTVITRLESGRGKPSTRTLERFAAATGLRLRIVPEPAVAGQGRSGHSASLLAEGFGCAGAAAGERVNEAVDWPHLIEEIADVGLGELRAC